VRKGLGAYRGQVESKDLGGIKAPPENKDLEATKGIRVLQVHEASKEQRERKVQ